MPEKSHTGGLVEIQALNTLGVAKVSLHWIFIHGYAFIYVWIYFFHFSLNILISLSTKWPEVMLLPFMSTFQEKQVVGFSTGLQKSLPNAMTAIYPKKRNAPESS